MGGQSASTQQQQPTPFISGPSDPRDMPDPLLEGIKYAAGKMGYGPSAAPSSAPQMQAPPSPPSPMPQQDSDYTIPPDPLIEALKWLTGAGAKNAPKRN